MYIYLSTDLNITIYQCHCASFHSSLTYSHTHTHTQLTSFKTTLSQVSPTLAYFPPPPPLRFKLVCLVALLLNIHVPSKSACESSAVSVETKTPDTLPPVPSTVPFWATSSSTSLHFTLHRRHFCSTTITAITNLAISTCRVNSLPILHHYVLYHQSFFLVLYLPPILSHQFHLCFTNNDTPHSVPQIHYF